MEDYKKKYEELYERISNLVRDYDCVSGLIDVSEELKSILNESQESGDERIKKGLIHYFKEQDGILTAISGNVSTRDVLAWLEKQGEKVDAIENFDTEFEKQVSCLIASTINKEHEYNKDFVKWTANTLLNYAKQELEKQGEQKPNFCHHEVDFSDCSEEYRKAYYDGWNNCNQQHAQLKAEQKPAWSEEDEKMFSGLNSIVEDWYNTMSKKEKEYYGDCGYINWLKSLKERMKGK